MSENTPRRCAGTRWRRALRDHHRMPSCASAHVACSRTSGSPSRSALPGTSTSSAFPTFPSTTAALRFNPRSFARFIGEPLSPTRNSSCVITSSALANARASFPAITSRGANVDASGIFRANFTFHGHTSWENCRYNHFRDQAGNWLANRAQGNTEVAVQLQLATRCRLSVSFGPVLRSPSFALPVRRPDTTPYASHRSACCVNPLTNPTAKSTHHSRSETFG